MKLSTSPILHTACAMFLVLATARAQDPAPGPAPGSECCAESDTELQPGKVALVNQLIFHLPPNGEELRECQVAGQIQILPVSLKGHDPLEVFSAIAYPVSARDDDDSEDAPPRNLASDCVIKARLLRGAGDCCGMIVVNIDVSKLVKLSPLPGASNPMSDEERQQYTNRLINRIIQCVAQVHRRYFGKDNVLRIEVVGK